jgi:hypothetical protein
MTAPTTLWLRRLVSPGRPRHQTGAACARCWTMCGYGM